MNNFRRTPRELMYTAKVNAITIVKRLEEFRDLDSAGLSVEDFRNIDLESTADPPSYTQNRNGKRKKGRRRKRIEFDDDGDELGDRPTPSNAIPEARMQEIPNRDSRELQQPQIGQLVTPPYTQQRGSTDAMPPPPVPLDPALQASSQLNSNRTETRPAQTQTRIGTRSQNRRASHMTQTRISPPQQSPAPFRNPAETAGPSMGDLAAEGQQGVNPVAKRRKGRPKKSTGDASSSEDPEITAALTDPFNASASSLVATAEVAASAEAEASRRQSSSTLPTDQPRRDIPTSEIIGEDEFADDPEVLNCLLNEEEVEIKTRIWTSINADWLLKKASKQYQHELEVAEGTFAPKKTRQRRRRRIGDLSMYEKKLGPEWAKRLENGEGVADTAAESVQIMLEHRGYGQGKAFSAKINYDRIRELYTPSSSASRRTSTAPAESPSHGGQQTDVDSGQESESSNESVAERSTSAGERFVSHDERVGGRDEERSAAAAVESDDNDSSDVTAGR